MMRFRPFLLFLPALAACDGTTPIAAPTQVRARAPAAIADQGAMRIDCARRGAAQFAPLCTLERQVDNQGLLLTIRHPDGGFHRLRVTTDGRGVIAADGAERAHVSVRGSAEIEVALGGDRYRLPATVRSTSPPRP